MRIVTTSVVFAFLGFILFGSVGSAAGIPSDYSILKNPTQELGETLKKGVSKYDFYKSLPKINTFFGYERFFRKQSSHNPFVWRQGVYNPALAVPIPGVPFDIHTPAGTIPGCLNLLCPPPAPAVWYAGVCWCG